VRTLALLPMTVRKLLLLAWLFGCLPVSLALAGTGSLIRTEHFIVVDEAGSSAYARRAADLAERLYRRIMDDLGYAKRDDFWLWEKRCRIVICATRESFRQRTGAPEWAAGRASSRDREITTYAGSEAFLQTVLPHELTHLVFREFVGFVRPIPFWLDEGVAQMEEREGLPDRRMLRAMWRDQRLVPLSRLVKVSSAEDLSPEEARQAYAQAAGLIRFLVDRHGAERFQRFCVQIRDGKSVDEALAFTYAPAIRNIEALERAYIQSLEGKP
jgi:hypothetical protein